MYDRFCERRLHHDYPVADAPGAVEDSDEAGHAGPRLAGRHAEMPEICPQRRRAAAAPDCSRRRPAPGSAGQSRTGLGVAIHFQAMPPCCPRLFSAALSRQVTSARSQQHPPAIVPNNHANQSLRLIAGLRKNIVPAWTQAATEQRRRTRNASRTQRAVTLRRSIDNCF